MALLLFIYNGIPRIERISQRQAYWNVIDIVNLLNDSLNEDPSTYGEGVGQIVEFFIDETPQGKGKSRL
jgi:hypothetical protein